jgi:GH15 family glucan-1,4-alpha-glucosidase
LSQRIEDYALIGDTHTAALVGKEGSIDWLCLPHFDSQAFFAAILGDEENGHWRIGPDEEFTVHRRYRPNTLILETTFETESGAVTLIDFMPLGHDDDRADLVRIVRGDRGSVRMCMDLTMRFSYGSAVPWVRRIEDGQLAVAGPDALHLHTTVPIVG